jgi:predicted DNA-binding transcriptional regulator YafY
MALQTLSIYQGSPLFEKFNDVINRIMASSVLRKISKKDSGKYIQISEMYGNTGQEWLEKIYNAISEKQTLVIHYESFGNKASIRTISPYQLREFRNKWYMIAHAKEIRNENKTILFKLSRIQKIDDCYEDYFIDQKFNSTDYFKHSLGVFHKHDEEPINVKLKINGGLMKLISEDKIHHSMVIESKTEKEMIVTFKVYNSPELETLILGYGNNCKVLEPLSLANEIKKRVKLTMEIYN